MYNQDDDKLIKEFEEDGINIKVGIYSYKGGNPKIQITRKSEERQFIKLGRLNIDEIKFLKSHMDEIIEVVESVKV
jgi:hypothetical protein